MAELLEGSSSLESTTVGIYRTAATSKGGRRFSFSALVVVGDRRGQAGLGYAKANQVPPAIEKAQKEARRKLTTFPLQGKTIPHTVTGRFGACSVRLVPASPGTGILAGAAVRAPLEMVGVQDCLTKAYGSTNPKNLVKAVLNGLEQLRTRETVAKLRGVELEATDVETAIERSRVFMPATGDRGAKMAAPVNTVGQETRRGGKRGGGGGHDRGPRRGPRAKDHASQEHALTGDAEASGTHA
jgi:small subunit ribosomal protein S5